MSIRSVGHSVKEFISSTAWPSRPQALAFEITSVCDAKCIHCPRQEMDRPMRAMEFDLFCKMIDEAAELGVPDLTPNGYGEIMTMPDAERYLAYISKKHPKGGLILNTNGHRMDGDKLEMLFRHNIKLINISIDGATAETAQKVRVNLKTDRIEENIRRFLARRRELGRTFPKIRVGMVLIAENKHEGKAFLEKWNGVTDFVGLSGFSSRVGSVPEDRLPTVGAEHNTATACVLPFRDLNIWADGKAVLCCQDWNEEHVVGDLRTQHLREIWRGPALTKVRELHRQRRGAEVPLCGKCNMWLNPGWGSRMWV